MSNNFLLLVFIWLLTILWMLLRLWIRTWRKLMTDLWSGWLNLTLIKQKVWSYLGNLIAHAYNFERDTRRVPPVTTLAASACTLCNLFVRSPKYSRSQYKTYNVNSACQSSNHFICKLFFTSDNTVLESSSG
jgi:hypothetical protein